MLGPGDFNPARDITLITVNRWPHGYTYKYNPLFDPDWQKGEASHEVGRARFGPITIARFRCRSLHRLSDRPAYGGRAG